VRASRWLERETQRNVDVMWLLKKLTPDHKTIADFRAVPPEAIKAVCREFTALCKALDLFGGERVAIEGTFRVSRGQQPQPQLHARESEETLE